MVRIAMVYDVARWEEKALVKAAEARSVRLDPIHIKSVPLYLDGGQERPLGEADVVLQRSLSHHIALESAAILESLGYRVVNSFMATALVHDKVWTICRLSQHGVPVPRTAVAFSESAASVAAEELGYPVVIKPVDGSWGRLVSLARDTEDLQTILEHRSYMPNPMFRVHLIQEFVRKPGRDIRVYVVGDEAPVAIYRVSDHWVTNTARGGRAEPAQVSGELEELAVKAAQAVGIEVAGIDVFEDPERGLVVNEINAVPDFKNTVAVTGYDLPGRIIDYLVEQVKR
jgi:[lysine-biosynthesis-protein LysW]--L-2-aminoadipate ligase